MGPTNTVSAGRDEEWEAAAVLAATLGVGFLVTLIAPAVLERGLPLAVVLAAAVITRLPTRLAEDPLLTLTYEVAGVAIILSYLAGLTTVWPLAPVSWLVGTAVVVARAATGRGSSAAAIGVRAAGFVPVAAHLLAMTVIYVNTHSELLTRMNDAEKPPRKVQRRSSSTEHSSLPS